MMRTRYVGELESVRQNLIAMGETTIALLSEALGAVVDCAAATMVAPASRITSTQLQSLARPSRLRVFEYGCGRVPAHSIWPLRKAFPNYSAHDERALVVDVKTCP